MPFPNPSILSSLAVGTVLYRSNLSFPSESSTLSTQSRCPTCRVDLGNHGNPSLFLDFLICQVEG